MNSHIAVLNTYAYHGCFVDPSSSWPATNKNMVNDCSVHRIHTHLVVPNYNVVGIFFQTR